MGLQGLDGEGIRDSTGVHVPLVNYHFFSPPLLLSPHLNSA